MFPVAHYIFKHALLEDALYNALVKGKRQQFHGRIAEALEARFPQTTATQPELVAHHFTEAGLAEAAIGYWLKAGLRSRERSAENEAIGHLTRGLALLGALDESPERDARELELLSALGTAYIASRGYAAPESARFSAGRASCASGSGSHRSSSRSSWASGSGISSAARSGSVWSWSPRRWNLPGPSTIPAA